MRAHPGNESYWGRQRGAISPGDYARLVALTNAEDYEQGAERLLGKGVRAECVVVAPLSVRVTLRARWWWLLLASLGGLAAQKEASRELVAAWLGMYKPITTQVEVVWR